MRGVGVQREDRRDVRARGARQAQAVLLRARVRALVRAHAAGAVVLDPHPAEEAAARAARAVRAGVVLGVRPHRRLAVAHERPLQLPALEQLGRRRVGVAALRAGPGRSSATTLYGERAEQRRPLLGVDHVVGRRHEVGQRPRDGGLVVKRAQRLDVGHAAAEASSGPRGPRGGPVRELARGRAVSGPGARRRGRAAAASTFSCTGRGAAW